jgi:uncharacterized protein YuzE
MKISYDDQADVLCFEFSDDAVVRDVSYGWDVTIGYGEHGIADITILDAKAKGYWPIENLADFLTTST